MAGQVRIPNTVPTRQGTALPVQTPYRSRADNKNPKDKDKEAQTQVETKGSGAARVLQGPVGQRRLWLPVL